MQPHSIDLWHFTFAYFYGQLNGFSRYHPYQTDLLRFGLEPFNRKIEKFVKREFHDTLEFLLPKVYK